MVFDGPNVLYVLLFLPMVLIIWKKNWLEKVLYFSLYVYICNFLALVFFPISFDKEYITWLREANDSFKISDTINLVPFHDIFKSGLQNTQPLKHDLLNALLFVPLGVYLPLLFKKTMRETLLTGFLISIAVETCQLMLSVIYQTSGWYADITDVITNTIGVMFGFAAFKIYKKVMNT